jgi:hypothetical protein
LHHKVSCEPIGRFDDDGLGAIRFQGFEHLSEAGTGVDGIRALDRFIMEGADQPNACALCESFDGLELPPPTVLVLTDVSG